MAEDNGKIIWHPTFGEGESLENYSQDFSPIAAYIQTKDNSGESTITYTFRGERKEMAFTTLANGMKMIVVAPSREINAGWHMLIVRMIAAGLLVMGVFVILTVVLTGQITKPLQRLTEASQQLLNGNYNVELAYDGQDEVGMLTEAFLHLTEHLKTYISDLNSRVYRDALTGVRNKGGFDIFCSKLNDTITEAELSPSFAVVMFDCDDLKSINDVYGHEKGDQYLQTACHLICETFTHSPVFRIGGDEFVAVLQQEDYIRRNELLTTFERGAEAINAGTDKPWEKVCISKGLVLFDPKLDADVESVLARADARMYADKKARKQGR